MSEKSLHRRDPHEGDATFIGRGFGWPLGVDHTGAIRLSDGVADLARSLAIVLVTAPGERVKLEKLVAELGLGVRVLFTGAVPAASCAPMS